MTEKPYGEILDEMDHEAKYLPASADNYREQELRIQALGAALSRRDWNATERAYEAIRDKFYASAVTSTSSAAQGTPSDPDWKYNCLSALKLLHEALDVIEAIDSECLLPGQLQDMVDAVLAPRRNSAGEGVTPAVTSTHRCSEGK